MSELYKADASNFTREQLVELINHQTNLHLEGKAILIIAKGKIEELEHKLALAKNEIDKLKYELSCHKIIKKMRKERPFDDE